MKKIIYIEEGVFIIQKEILRTIKGSDMDMKIWCANSQYYGYSEDYNKVKEEADRLNKENSNKNIRFALHEIKELK